MADDGVTWNDIGPLNPGQSKDLTINVTVGPDFRRWASSIDLAKATGVCGPAAGTAGAEAAVGVPLEARVTLDLPEVDAALGALLPRELPRTGGLFTLLPGPCPDRRRAGAAGRRGAASSSSGPDQNAKEGVPARAPPLRLPQKLARRPACGRYHRGSRRRRRGRGSSTRTAPARGRSDRQR